MKRIVVVGSSGSGKTTFSKRLSELTGLPHLEMDSVFHRGGWNRQQGDRFRKEVAGFAAGSGWIIDGNYTSHGTTDVVWPRADAFIWLDPPRRVVMTRVIGRTLRRVITREELWEGVREPWTNLYRLDPERNIVVWAWTRYEHVRKKYQSCLTSGAWEHADVHRLRSRYEVERFLATVYDSAPSGQ